MNAKPFIACLALSLTVAAASAQGGPSSDGLAQTKIDAAKAQVVASEARLDECRRLLVAGAASTGDLLRATISLAEARVTLAKAVGDDQGLETQLENVVSARERSLELARQRAGSGGAPVSEVSDERALLARARIRKETFTLVRLAQVRLAEEERRFAAGAVDSTTLSASRKALAKAREVWERSEGDRR